MKSVTHVGAEFVTEDDGNQFFNTLTSLICHGIYTPPSSLKLSHIFLTSLGCHNWRISFLLHFFRLLTNLANLMAGLAGLKLL